MLQQWEFFLGNSTGLGRKTLLSRGEFGANMFGKNSRTWFSVFPVRLPKADWAAPVAESMYDFIVEDSLSDMIAYVCDQTFRSMDFVPVVEVVSGIRWKDRDKWQPVFTLLNEGHGGGKCSLGGDVDCHVGLERSSTSAD